MDSNNSNHSLTFNHSTNDEPENAITGIKPVSTAVAPKEDDGSITWTASEFIAHQKTLVWYVVLLIGAVVLAGLSFILTKDKTTAIAIVVAALLLMVGAAKKPRELDYRLDKDGLRVADKLHEYDQFRSFAIVHQGAFSSVVFLPLKRFSMLTQVFYDPTDEQKIIDIVSNYLPLDEKKRDWFDELMWRIKY